MAAAGAGPGRYRIGRLEIEVGDDGVVREPGQRNFAGSSLTMDRAAENAGSWLGWSTADAGGGLRRAGSRGLGLAAGCVSGKWEGLYAPTQSSSRRVADDTVLSVFPDEDCKLDFAETGDALCVMTASAQQVLDDALRLPLAERELLAEKLVASLVTSLDPQIEQAHLQAVQERRAAYKAGRSELIDGDEALKHIRAAIRR